MTCLCGCGETPKYRGAKFVHGHHLRLTAYKRKPVDLKPKTCKLCKREFLPKKRGSYKSALYCSRQCASAGHIKRLRRCLNCAGEFIPNNGRNVNCSRACRSAWALKQGLPGSYRVNAWKIFQKKCSDCGWDKIPQLLVVHHIDGDRGNGAISNLVPLCPTCHSTRHFLTSGSARQVSARHS